MLFFWFKSVGSILYRNCPIIINLKGNKCSTTIHSCSKYISRPRRLHVPTSSELHASNSTNSLIAFLDIQLGKLIATKLLRADKQTNALPVLDSRLLKLRIQNTTGNSWKSQTSHSNQKSMELKVSRSGASNKKCRAEARHHIRLCWVCNTKRCLSPTNQRNLASFKGQWPWQIHQGWANSTRDKTWLRKLPLTSLVLAANLRSLLSPDNLTQTTERWILVNN